MGRLCRAEGTSWRLGVAVEGDAAYIFDGEVKGWGSLEAGEEGGGSG